MPRAKPTDDNMRAEYDFSGAVRGKYADRFASMGVQVTLDPDVAKVFGTSKAVNEALRTLARIEKARARKPAAARRKKAG